MNYALTSKTKLLLLGTLVALSVLFIQSLLPQRTQALSGSEFDAGRIIDDSIFYNSTSMGVAEIQQFLNSKVPVCDTNGTQWHSSGRTRAEHGIANGVPPPYICLKDFSQSVPTVTNSGSDLCTGSISAGTKSAAQIIFDAAQACGVSPKVLIVLLQKEQSLVTDDWPWPIQYRSATGYGCPDTAPCDAEFYGFFNQVYQAAKAYKRYRANPTNYNYRANRSNTILWHPNTGCGTSSVHIHNQATAGLYIYTPYRPNNAALQNLYGTGDSCSSYGNRNFWRLFRDWFGSTYGVPYAWSIENFTYSGGDNIIPAGTTETITLRARNLGLVPWYNHGDHPIRLRTWEPIGRHSSLFGGTLLATLTESVVLPNEVGTFTFQVTPTTIGTYAESINLVAENYTWFPWTGLRPTLVVPQAYSWQVQNVIYEKGTGMMDPGSKQLITVIAKNTGTATWSKSSGPPIKLATWAPDRKSSAASGWLSSTRVALMNENSVVPGQTAGFQFYVYMPKVGQSYERLNLVAEGQKWFNDANLTLYLFGNSYSWSVDSVSYSAGTGLMNQGSTQTITVKARNTGTTIWKNSGNFPIKLGTWQPQRQSQVSTAWQSPTRMATLSEATVAPGQVGTFTATVNMPSTGLFYERMNLLAEGLLWFNDTGLTFYLQGK